MAHGLGVDIGTSTTGAGTSRGGDAVALPLGVEGRTATAVAAAATGGLVTGDAALSAGPGGVVRDFKRRLGDPSPVVLGGRPHPPQELLAAIVRDTVSASSLAMGAAQERVVLTCPGIWGPYRRGQFAEVPVLAGVPGARVVTDAEAVAVRYGGLEPPAGRVVVVFDLGAASFDTAVLRSTGDGWELLAPAEGTEQVSGRALDAVVREMLAEQAPGDRTWPDAVCERARHQLSRQTSVTVPLPGGDGEAHLSRADFERRASPLVQAALEAVHRVLTSTGVDVGAVDEILLAGGATRTPLVRSRLEAEFGRLVRSDVAPENAAAIGAAMLAASELPVDAGAATTAEDGAERDADLAAAPGARIRERLRAAAPVRHAGIAVLAAGMLLPLVLIVAALVLLRDGPAPGEPSRAGEGSAGTVTQPPAVTGPPTATEPPAATGVPPATAAGPPSATATPGATGRQQAVADRPLALPVSAAPEPTVSRTTTAPPAVFRTFVIDAADPRNTHQGLEPTSCPRCESGTRMRQLNPGNSLTVAVPDVPLAGPRTLTLSYVSAETRELDIRANGTTTTLTLPGNGSWEDPQRGSATIRLVTGDNTIVLENPRAPSVDVDRLIIS